MEYFNCELESGEKFIALIRKHWAVLTLPTAKVIISLAVIILLRDEIIEFQYGKDVVLVWIISLILYGVNQIIVWYMDCFIITDRRIIDIDQKSFFKRIVAEVGIDNIQETVYEINGPLEAILNFGTVKIKTASSGSMIGMEQIPNPAKVKNLIVMAQKEKTNSGFPAQNKTTST